METDHDLMRAVSEGDAVSFASLYDRYSPAVLALCIRILRSRAYAEELLSDVFQEVWNRPERYDPARGNVLTYLITLARSRAIDRLRSRNSICRTMRTRRRLGPSGCRFRSVHRT